VERPVANGDTTMPERPPHEQYRRPRPLEGPAPPRPAAGPLYAELHCYTNFSFLCGASHPDELVQRAVELGYAALAITDRHSLAGVVRAHVAARDAGLKLLVGAEITPQDGPTLVLLATDRAAYGRLADLLSRGKLRAPKGECRLTVADLAEFAAGLLACVPLPPVLDDPPREALHAYRGIFQGRCYALAELHRGPNDPGRLERMRTLARQLRLPLAAANSVLYHEPKRQFLHHVLTAVRQKCTVAELDHRLFPNAERHLRSPSDMRQLFAACPDAVARTTEIAGRCQFSLDELRYEYPRELCPPGTTPLQHLKRLTWEGAKQRYPDGVPERVLGLLRHEMQLIEDLRYEAYFLTVWDLVRFARGRSILCQGRGSAANSVVCFCLGVTSVDPERIDVLFERFVSKERDEAPDIDIDFEHERREEVLQYIYEKYGRERAGMTAEVITYRIRSAVREVSKALGLSADQVDALARAQEHFFEDDKLASRFTEAGLQPDSRVGRQLAYLVREILGFPRHLSQHVGGMVITQGPLRQLVPIENAAMPGRTVIEWDKDDLDALGILKVDCLGLGMLTAIRKGFDLVAQHHGETWTLATVPAEDPRVYAMIQQADTVGVFQIESRAQMSMLPRLRPNCFYDLVIEVAIVRPGPIQGDMVHPYLRRRSGAEPVEYPDERVRAVLHKTLGVPLFQEQAMRLAVVAAGFTPGEADRLRRAMGAWRKRGVIETFRQKLIDGMLANGYTQKFAEQVFLQISGFGEYGFPESHAASFALLVYVSAWLKCYYPAVFTAALLNAQPMGFYQPAQLVGDARKHGVEVRPVDVNFSEWDCTLEANPKSEIRNPKSEVWVSDFRFRISDFALRLGLRLVRGLARAHADTVVQSRGSGEYVSFDDFVHRTGLHGPALSRLADADAFSSLGLDRRSALWRSLDGQVSLPLFDGEDANEPAVTLPIMPAVQEVLCDYRNVGLSLKGHPIQFLRDRLDALGVVPAAALAELANGRWLRVAGVVLMRQRPSTANGITFVTLEDETGQANLIIRPQIWDRYHTAARSAAVLLAHGRLQREGQVIHLLTHRLEDLTAKLAQLPARSRDFR
jgi:error-prone DNA polymerase